MNNKVNRFVPEGYRPFVSSSDYQNKERKLIKEKKQNNKIVFLKDIKEVFDYLNIQSGQTISFHHHLRNGDYVQNMVSQEVLRRDLK